MRKHLQNEHFCKMKQNFGVLQVILAIKGSEKQLLGDELSFPVSMVYKKIVPLYTFQTRDIKVLIAFDKRVCVCFSDFVFVDFRKVSR